MGLILTFHSSRSTLLTTASENEALWVHGSKMFCGFIAETSVCTNDNDGFPSKICLCNRRGRALVAEQVQRSFAHDVEVEEEVVGGKEGDEEVARIDGGRSGFIPSSQYYFKQVSRSPRRSAGIVSYNVAIAPHFCGFGTRRLVVPGLTC